MKRSFFLYLKGLAIGAADVVPGVSGGTIAFISGIYDELLHSISAVPTALPLLARGHIVAAWRKANGAFLLPLLLGILTSVFSFAKLITYLLEHEPVPVWSFFFGLVLISVYLVGREIQTWRHPSTLISFVVGAVLAYWITVAAPMQMGHDLLSLFLAGAIAICAMILPGISGSFILVLLGLYPLVLGAVKNFELGILAVFATGCMLGLLSFARLLSWMLDHWRSPVLSFLTGLMLGSLNKVWPWKETLTWQTTAEGHRVPLVQQSLWPDHYAQLTGQDSQWLLAMVLGLTGVVLVLGLEWTSKRRSVVSS